MESSVRWVKKNNFIKIIQYKKFNFIEKNLKTMLFSPIAKNEFLYEGLSK
jgi:hypothetical protein